MKKLKLAIIGANDFQNQLILKAKARGIETHVFAWQEGAIGEYTADYFYPISITEIEEILKKCQEIDIDGIVSIASDLAAITVNYVAEKMDLIGNGIESSIISTNKYAMRNAFLAAGDPSPQFYRSDELNENVIETLKFPMIVKPSDRSGSRGITKVENKKELIYAVNLAESLSFEKKAMIEEFVEGKEYSVEYISYEGVHHFLALTEKFTTGAPHYIETGHMQPAQVSEEIFENVKRIVEHALNTLKIRYGASHSEIKIDSNGNIKIIEIGGRMGGDCIGSDLVEISTGYDYVNMVIDIACNQPLLMKKVRKPKKAKIFFIFCEEDLRSLEEIKEKKPSAIYRISDIVPIEKEHKITDSSARYGYYILSEDFE